MKFTKATFLICVLLLCGGEMLAQPGKKKYNTWSVTATGGPLLFYGDIKQYDWYPVKKYQNERKLGYGISVQKSLNHVFGLQAQVLKGNLAGTRRQQGVYFNADLWEYSLNGQVYLNNVFFTGNYKPRRMNYYFTAGVGLVDFRTELLTLGSDVRVASFGFAPGPTERTTETVIPFGFGAKYALNKKFDLGLEMTSRNVNTDKLDARVSPGSAKDKYSFTNVTLTYNIGKYEKSMDKVNPMNQVYEEIAQLRAKVDSVSEDRDADGVADIFDKDNSTPSGVNVTTRGVAMDIDNDSIPDFSDKDPFSAKGAKVDIFGKEIDTDADGVPDGMDLEPNTPAGNQVNFQGKTIITKEGSSVTVSTLPSVYFVLDGFRIEDQYSEQLTEIARMLKQNPGSKLKLTGHTDPTASEKYNMELGKKRAEAVKSYMIKNFRLSDDQVITESKGESEIISPTKSRLNRRVVLEIVK